MLPTPCWHSTSDSFPALRLLHTVLLLRDMQLWCALHKMAPCQGSIVTEASPQS